jgi:hypothetical protein
LIDREGNKGRCCESRKESIAESSVIEVLHEFAENVGTEGRLLCADDVACRGESAGRVEMEVERTQGRRARGQEAKRDCAKGTLNHQHPSLEGSHSTRSLSPRSLSSYTTTSPPYRQSVTMNSKRDEDAGPIRSFSLSLPSCAFSPSSLSLSFAS